MHTLTRAAVETCLIQYLDPYLKQDLLSAKVVQQIDIQGHELKIKCVFGFPLGSYAARVSAALKSVLAPLTDQANIDIDIQWRVEPHVGQRGIKRVANIKNIIAVGSGKGGVGKSTTALNLALALKADGARVGILDADIYGPSQPTMLGAAKEPVLKEKKTLLPIVCYGLQTMSIGYLVDQSSAMIWRGPMVSTAVQQLLNETLWDDLDYLIIDLPPGTGDIQLTMAQKMPVSGAVIVTTPQELALLDAKRAIEMFRKVNIPVLGVLENMGAHTCSHCGHTDAIFDQGGGQKLSGEYAVPMLGTIPLDPLIRMHSDLGRPVGVSHPELPLARQYTDMARQVAASLSLQPKDYSHKFPNIVVKNE